jgi:hypothetical protein
LSVESLRLDEVEAGGRAAQRLDRKTETHKLSVESLRLDEVEAGGRAAQRLDRKTDTHKLSVELSERLLTTLYPKS